MLIRQKIVTNTENEYYCILKLVISTNFINITKQQNSELKVFKRIQKSYQWKNQNNGSKVKIFLIWFHQFHLFIELQMNQILLATTEPKTRILFLTYILQHLPKFANVTFPLLVYFYPLVQIRMNKKLHKAKANFLESSSRFRKQKKNAKKQKKFHYKQKLNRKNQFINNSPQLKIIKTISK